MMFMIVVWTQNCEFIFKRYFISAQSSWHTTELGPFLLGCFLTMLFSMALSTLPIVKKKATQSEHKFLLGIFWYFVSAWGSIIAMFLMMTMNGDCINFIEKVG